MEARVSFCSQTAKYCLAPKGISTGTLCCAFCLLWHVLMILQRKDIVKCPVVYASYEACLLAWRDNYLFSFIFSLCSRGTLGHVITSAGSASFLAPCSPATLSYLEIASISSSNTNEHFLRAGFHSYSQSYPLLLPIAWPTLLQALCMVNLSICVYGSIFSHEMWEHLKITAGI